MPDYWGIAGYPISHSLTPRLFATVGEHLGMEGVQRVFLEAGGMAEFESHVAGLKGELWLSCTAPLKHAPQNRLGIRGPTGVNAVNQLKRVDGEWSGTSTDGLGFVAACHHIGVEPSGTVLRMRGGGSAARSIAAAWATLGHKSLPAKSDAAPASTAGARVDFHLVDEHGVIIPRTTKKARRDTSPEMV